MNAECDILGTKDLAFFAVSTVSFELTETIASNK